jgi:hypothetical protein
MATSRPQQSLDYTHIRGAGLAALDACSLPMFNGVVILCR